MISVCECHRNSPNSLCLKLSSLSFCPRSFPPLHLVFPISVNETFWDSYQATSCPTPLPLHHSHTHTHTHTHIHTHTLPSILSKYLVIQFPNSKPLKTFLLILSVHWPRCQDYPDLHILALSPQCSSWHPRKSTISLTKHTPNLTASSPAPSHSDFKFRSCGREPRTTLPPFWPSHFPFPLPSPYLCFIPYSSFRGWLSCWLPLKDSSNPQRLSWVSKPHASLLSAPFTWLVINSSLVSNTTRLLAPSSCSVTLLFTLPSPVLAQSRQ